MFCFLSYCDRARRSPDGTGEFGWHACLHCVSLGVVAPPLPAVGTLIITFSWCLGAADRLPGFPDDTHTAISATLTDDIVPSHMSSPLKNGYLDSPWMSICCRARSPWDVRDLPFERPRKGHPSVYCLCFYLWYPAN